MSEANTIVDNAIAANTSTTEAPQEPTASTTEAVASNEVPAATTNTEAAPVEAKDTTTSTTAPEVKDNFSKKFALIAKKEKALRELEEKHKNWQKEKAEWDALQELKKTDPLTYLERLGMSYDDLTQQIINLSNKSEPESPKVKALEDRINELQMQTMQKETQIKVDKFINDLNTHIEANADKLPIVKATDASKTVIEVIATYYEQTGQELSIEQACDMVEEHLYNAETERLQKLLAVDKIKAKLNLAKSTTEATPTVKDEKPAEKTSAKVKTLSNAITSESPNYVKKAATEQERIQRAIQALNQIKK